jgi:heptosyltransferase III
MKILIIQLARFGDIYQTLPVLKALKRNFPQAELTCLVREKFKDATHEFSEFVKVKTLDTAQILSPLIFQARGEGDASARLNSFLSTSFEKYDRIINLSFSPFSSYLTDELTTENTMVKGYTRTHDGFLGLPDDVSAYFYAQVGTQRSNRVHLTDLFAMIAGVELTPEDWQCRTTQKSERSGIVIQIGASQAHKTLESQQWQGLIEKIHARSITPIYIVGSKEDQGTPLFLKDLSRVQDLRGANTLKQTFDLIAKSSLLIAPDSVTLHMASAVETPTFNISKGPVRFWETGPRASGSRVFIYDEQSNSALSDLMQAIEKMLAGQPPDDTTYEVTQKEGVIYDSASSKPDFSWRLVQALYMQGDYPEIETHKTVLALRRITELVDLGNEQLGQIDNPRARSVALSILNEIDFLMNQVCRIDASVQPLVNWFITQKIRITAKNFDEVLQQTKTIYADARTILNVYDKSISWSLDATKEVTWKP